MAFADEVVKDGRGRCHKVDVSFDSFVTTTYRWSDVAGVAGVSVTDDYDPRIIDLSPLSRGFGVDRIFQVSTIDITLANDDEGADWLFDTSSSAVINLYKMRARVYVGLYDKANPDTISWKQLGEFVFAEFPTRDDETVRISLADDGLGLLEHPAQLPTLRDWYDQDTNYQTNPLRASDAFATLFPWDTEIPVAFGEDKVPCLELGIAYSAPSGTLANIRGYAVCCTASSSALTANDVEKVWAEINENKGQEGFGTVYELPRQFVYNNTTYTLWTAYKSNTITKGGKSFKVLWVAIDKTAFYHYWDWYAQYYGIENDSGHPAYAKYPHPGDLLDGVLSAIKTLYVEGYPLSAMTTVSRYQSAGQIVYDLVAYYSRASASNIETESFDRVHNTYATMSAAGVVGGTRPDDAKPLREHLSDIAQGFDFDLAMSWSGQLRFSARLKDYTALTATFRTIDETRIAEVSEKWPTGHQRGAPFNRVFLENLRTSIVDNVVEPSEGPFDDPAGTVTSWTRAIPAALSAAWRPVRFLAKSPWEYRGIDGRHRTAITFKTDLEALLVDLGDYVYINWTRNLGEDDPYSDTLFQIEAMTYDPSSGEVEINALWMGDLSAARPYLLDSETLLTRASGNAGRTATVQNSVNTVNFSSGSLITDGVAVGDHLILKDSSEALDTFKRNKAVAITAINSATQLVVSDPLDSLDFGTAVALAVSEWEIRRSHVTYHTTASDAANYPDGGNMYGRVSSADSGGTFSAAGTGNFTDGHRLYEG